MEKVKFKRIINTLTINNDNDITPTYNFKYNSPEPPTREVIGVASHPR